jgi:hypothetical protein
MTTQVKVKKPRNTHPASISADLIWQKIGFSTESENRSFIENYRVDIYSESTAKFYN